MSNIGFAVDLPFTANGLPSNQVLEAVRRAGFDFVIWHTNLETNITDISFALREAGLKPIAFSVPGADFLDRPQDYLHMTKTHSVPDLVLLFELDTFSNLQACENVLTQIEILGTSDACNGVRLLLATPNPQRNAMFKNFAEQFSSMGHMLDTFGLAQNPDADIAATVRSLPDRCPLLIVQDIADQDTGRACAVGEGCLDWDAIFDAAEESSVEWYICRAENADSGLEQARKSLEYLTVRA